MNRAAAFVRSILPRDLTQLLFVAGSLLLFISPRIPWRRGFGIDLDVGSSNLPLKQLFEGGWVALASHILLMIAASAGFFLCVWPGKRPVRTVLAFVFIPSVWAVLAMCVKFLWLPRNAEFLGIGTSAIRSHFIPAALSILTQLGPGLDIAILGILCVSLFLSRLMMGLTSLPVSIGNQRLDDLKKADDWARISIFAWISINLVFVLFFVGDVPFIVLSYLTQSRTVIDDFNWSATASFLLGTGLLAGLAGWAIGGNRWVELKRILRFGDAKYLGLALVIPVVGWALSPLAFYIHDRVVWAASNLGIMPPVFSPYYSLPGWRWSAVLLLGAFIEEIAYRGFLQPRFVDRYGLYRGICLLGVLWGAFHWTQDFNACRTDTDVALRVIWRLGFCVATGFVLSWLTLQSESILPAAIAHGTYNSLLYSAYFRYPGLDSLSNLLFWGIVAYALFRWWPPRVGERPMAEMVPVVPEPAV